jgi:hypothetical protein
VLTTARVDSLIGSLCLFANGNDLGLGTYGGTLTILNSKSGAPLVDIRAYEESKYGDVEVGAIAGDPKGELILAGAGSITLSGPDPQSPEHLAWLDSLETIKMFRVKDGAELASLKAQDPIRQAAWDPQGRFVAFVDNAKELYLWAPWRTPAYKRIELPTKTLSLAISPRGDRLAVATDYDVAVYSIH